MKTADEAVLLLGENDLIDPNILFFEKDVFDYGEGKGL